MHLERGFPLGGKIHGQDKIVPTHAYSYSTQCHGSFFFFFWWVVWCKFLLSLIDASWLRLDGLPGEQLRKICQNGLDPLALSQWSITKYDFQVIDLQMGIWRLRVCQGKLYNIAFHGPPSLFDFSNGCFKIEFSGHLPCCANFNSKVPTLQLVGRNMELLRGKIQLDLLAIRGQSTTYVKIDSSWSLEVTAVVIHMSLSADGRSETKNQRLCDEGAICSTGTFQSI